MRTIKNALLSLVVLTLGIGSMSAQGEGEWKSVSPNNLAGRMLAVHVDVNNSQKVYAGAAGGGLWITTNGGVTWKRCIGFTGSSAVAAIAQSSDGTLYVGTGEGICPGYEYADVPANFLPRGIQGDGMYKSTDGGKTFTLLSGSVSWTYINSIAYDNVHNKLYVATNGGLRVSSDGGTTFSTPSNRFCTQVTVGSDGTVIYCQRSNSGRHEAYISTDGGGSFQLITGSGKIPTTMSTGRISAAFAPSDPNMIYAMVANDNEGGLFAGVFLSRDKGETWAKIFNEGGSMYPLGYGVQYNAMAVSTLDPTHVFAAGYRMYSGSQDSGSTKYSWEERHLRSADGGRELIRNVYSISFAPNDTMYVACDYGIAKSVDGGIFFTYCNTNLSTLQLNNLAVANDGRIVAGTRGRGTIFTPYPKQAIQQGYQLADNKEIYFTSGSFSAFSLIKSESMFFTGSYGMLLRQGNPGNDAQLPHEWFYMKNKQIMSSSASTVRFPYWYPGGIYPYPGESSLSATRPLEYVTPIVFWESVDDQNSTDTTIFIADKNYLVGEKMCVKSKRNYYPIWVTFNRQNGKDTLKTGETLKIHDVITSRLFYGGAGFRYSTTDSKGVGAPVFMSVSALNLMNNDQDWMQVFSTSDTTEQVIDLKVSKDGEHLFVLTKTNRAQSAYSIYRVTGFDTYRDRTELNVNLVIGVGDTAIYSTGTPNPLRVLTDDTLLFKKTGIDILSIALDPQNDNQLIYTTMGAPNSDLIVLIPNATTATLSNVSSHASKRGTGLPLVTGKKFSIYTALIEMNNSNIAFIGTDEGVYKTENFTSNNPTWKLYNEGISVKVPVFKLFQQSAQQARAFSVTYNDEGNIVDSETFPEVSNRGLIYAATHGLGIFVDSTYFEAYNTLVEFPTAKKETSPLYIYPNPTSDYVNIGYVLDSKSDVVIEIIDNYGRVVNRKVLNGMPEGEHVTQMDCTSLTGRIYVVSLRTQKKQQNAKLLIYR